MLNSVAVILVVLSMLFVNPATAAQSLMGVQEVTHRGQALTRDKILSELNNPDVQVKLSALGISADEAKNRIAALSEQEVRDLVSRGAKLEAGGDAGLVVVLLLVIIIVLLIR